MSWKKALLVVVLAAVLMACTGQAPKGKVTPTPTATAPEKIEIPIGVLVDLSGPLSTAGTSIKNSLAIAEKEINSYFENKNEPYLVKFYIEDTVVTPKIAMDKLQALHSGKGIRLFIGPMGSGEVKQVSEYVTANKIIIISPSSTALPILIGVTKPEEKKYIFRFVATDDLQTKAIAKEVSELGIKAVVITYLGNAWGKGLTDLEKERFKEYNIEVKSSVEYPDPPPTDFSPYIATLENAVNELEKSYNLSEIGIVAFSYGEVATMLSQVKDDSVLLKVKWIGCDGTANIEQISEICDKANKVKLYSTLFQSTGTELYKKFENEYITQFGNKPHQYGINAYDAAWVLALSYAEVYDKLGHYDPDEMANTIPVVTEKYNNGEYGTTPISGAIKLNEYNDRSTGDYAIYSVENCTWVLKGFWKFDTNEIKWT